MLRPHVTWYQTKDSVRFSVLCPPTKDQRVEFDEKSSKLCYLSETHQAIIELSFSCAAVKHMRIESKCTNITCEKTDKSKWLKSVVNNKKDLILSVDVVRWTPDESDDDQEEQEEFPVSPMLEVMKRSFSQQEVTEKS
jgi:hypothetical protein